MIADRLRVFRLRSMKVTWARVLVSLFIVGLGLTGARALSQVDADLRIIYQEYTLAAVDLAHISHDVIRYRAAIIQAVEARNKSDFERIIAALPERRARIQHAADRYAAASLRVSRSGRSEPQDLQAVRDSLDAYFAAASRTIMLMIRAWNARTPQETAALRGQAEVHAADNSGPKMIQLSLALDRLLLTVADVASDMRDEGRRTIRTTSVALAVGGLLIAVFNLMNSHRSGGQPLSASQTVTRVSPVESS